MERRLTSAQGVGLGVDCVECVEVVREVGEVRVDGLVEVEVEREGGG